MSLRVVYSCLTQYVFLVDRDRKGTGTHTHKLTHTQRIHKLMEALYACPLEGLIFHTVAKNKRMMRKRATSGVNSSQGGLLCGDNTGLILFLCLHQCSDRRYGSKVIHVLQVSSYCKAIMGLLKCLQPLDVQSLSCRLLTMRCLAGSALTLAPRSCFLQRKGSGKAALNQRRYRDDKTVQLSWNSALECTQSLLCFGEFGGRRQMTLF